MEDAQEYSDKDHEIKELRKELQEKEEAIHRYKEELAHYNLLERWKIGSYLHDELAQQLLAVKFTINFIKDESAQKELMERCQEVIEIVDKSIKEVRDLSHDIIPIDVEEEGVGEAFKHLKSQTEKIYGINCILETENKILEKINRRKVATNLYNITQEAIKNAVIHGDANNIKIALIEHGQQLYLHVKDDGKGFETNNEESGMGITIMKHRAEEMDGRLRIREAKEDSTYSTLVTCTIPLKALENG